MTSSGEVSSFNRVESGLLKHPPGLTCSLVPVLSGLHHAGSMVSIGFLGSSLSGGEGSIMSLSGGEGSSSLSGGEASSGSSSLGSSSLSGAEASNGRSGVGLS